MTVAEAVTKFERGEIALSVREMSSAEAVIESVATPLVGTGSMVGPGSESVAKEMEAWLTARLRSLDKEIALSADRQEYRDADRLGIIYSAMVGCRSHLRAEMARSEMRQPRPNHILGHPHENIRKQ